MDKLKRKRLMATAMGNLRATANDHTKWSYLCSAEVETFGFFLWDWCEGAGIDRTDEEAALACAESGEEGIAWIVPIELANKVEGYALFTGHAGNAAEDEPLLEGVFDAPDAAKAHLKASGVVAED